MEIRGIGSGSRMCKLTKNRKKRKPTSKKVGFLLHQRYETIEVRESGGKHVAAFGGVV